MESTWSGLNKEPMNLDVLRERAQIVSAIRRFFDDDGFVEVETAVRIPAPAPEEHIDCPPVEGGGFLRASPELQMKKLLAAGLDKIYQIGPCFREGERGSRHNPEFTMIEWYRRGAGYLDIKADLENLFASLAQPSNWFGGLRTQDSRLRAACKPRPATTNASTNWFGGLRTQDSRLRAACKPRPTTTNASTSQPPNFPTLKVRDAYRQHAGWDPWTDWDQDRFDFDMATKIEPAIREMGGGVFLTDYPPQAASLAKLSPFPAEPGLRFAERWEFYFDGMELANCFTELCDGEEQRRRFEKAKAARQALGEADYPIDEDFLARLDSIGSAAGVALGVDRLVMVLLGVKDISAVRAEV